MEPSLLAAHDMHLKARTRLRRRPQTLKAYRVYVGAYLKFLEDRGIEPTLAALNLDLAGDFQDWIRARSFGSRDGAAAERQAVRLVKTFARWLWLRGFLAVDPLARLQLPHLVKLHRTPFTESEVRRLVQAARVGPRPILERALLLLSFDTGARISEVCGLELADVDLERGVVLFRRTKTGRPRRVIVGVAELPGGGPCVEVLRALLAERSARDGVPALFTGADGEALSVRQVRRIWRVLGVAAHVADCIPHRGRHTHASELLAELPGAELGLRNRLGHLSKDVLADYITISERSAREIASVASLSAKWNL